MTHDVPAPGALASLQETIEAGMTAYNARTGRGVVGRMVIGAHSRTCSCGHAFESAGEMYYAGNDALSGEYLKFCLLCMSKELAKYVSVSMSAVQEYRKVQREAKAQAEAADRAKKVAEQQAAKAQLEGALQIAREAVARRSAGTGPSGAGETSSKRMKPTVELDRAAIDAGLAATCIKSERVGNGTLFLAAASQAPNHGSCSACTKPFASGDLRYSFVGPPPTQWCAPCMGQQLGGSYVKREWKCAECQASGEELHKQHCSDCGDPLGCTECWPEFEATNCNECEEIFCQDCSDHIGYCDSCNLPKCRDCTDFKPSKHGEERCSTCQPWWQKNKPATAFCRDCGSQRSSASICEGCGARVCHECEIRVCEDCNEGVCARCDGGWCEQCSEIDIIRCADCCPGVHE